MQLHVAGYRGWKVMKISYMLVNHSSLGLSMPIGAAWHWIHQVNDEKHMRSVLERLKRITHEGWLTVANLRINQRECSNALLENTFAFKVPVLYDQTIAPKRIIHLHEDDEEENLQQA
jgi:hypothetical protein